jgi:hypothetical protein
MQFSWMKFTRLSPESRGARSERSYIFVVGRSAYTRGGTKIEAPIKGTRPGPSTGRSHSAAHVTTGETGGSATPGLAWS